MAIQTPGFDGFLGGWLAREDRKQQMMERDRQNAAYNALFETYGPVAGDPVAYGQLAGIKRAEDRAPLELEALALGNRGAEQGIEQSNALFPVTLEQAKLGNVQLTQTIGQSAERFPLEQEQRLVNIEGGRLGNRGQRLGNAVVEGGLEDAETARRRQALTSGVRLLTGVRDNGGDLGLAFDRLLPTLKAIGMEDGDIAEARSQIINDPTTLDAMAASLTGFPPPSKATTAKAGSTNPDGTPLTEEQKYRARERGKQAAKAEADAYDVEAKANQILDNAIAETAPIKADIEWMLADPDFVDDAFGWDSYLGVIPSTAQRDARAKLEQVRNAITVRVISALKAASSSGATGFSNLSDGDRKVIESAVTNLEQAQSPEAGRKALKHALTVLGSYETRARAAVDRDVAAAKKKAAGLWKEAGSPDGEAGDDARGGGVPLPPELSGTPDGTVIEADDGTPYVVQGGRLVPQ